MSRTSDPKLEGHTPSYTTWIKSDETDPLYGNRPAYSFADAQANLMMPFANKHGSNPVIAMPGLTMISWSTHRDKYPVTGLGKTRIRGHTYGHRTTAGTLGFTVSGENPFAGAIRQYNQWRGKPDRYAVTEPDSLPPMDLSIVFVTPAGRIAKALVRGITILDTANSMSVQNIQLTDVYSFMAQSASNIAMESRPVLAVGDETANPGRAGNPVLSIGNDGGLLKIFSPPELTTEDLNQMNAGEAGRSA